MKNFILLLQFFTRLPINKNYEYKHKEYGQKTYLLPLVGLIIGIFVFGIGKGLVWLQMPKEIYGILLVLSWIFLTGALHLDGFADSVDGIFSYRSKDKILEIMKDPHIGTNGVIGLILVILLKLFLFINVPLTAVAFSFVIGRFAIIVSASLGSYAREKGMALAIIEYNNKGTLIKSSILFFIIAIFFKGYIPYILVTIVFIYCIHKWIVKKIDGITGDTLGFLCEMTEILFLFFIFLGGKNGTFGIY